MNTILTFSSLLVIHINLVAGDAVVEVKFTKFQNDKGRLADGSKCDFWSDCDPQFVFCLGTDPGRSTCNLGRYESGHYHDKNNVDFGSDIKGVVNPIVRRMDAWSGQMSVRVNVTDKDIFHDEDLDFHLTTVSVTQPDTQGVHRWHTKSSTGTRSKYPTRLEFEYSVYCRPYYYGPSCTVKCVPRDDELGHYTCEAPSGDKVCRLGWVDPDTNCTREDHCYTHPCLNNGTCVEQTSGYPSCVCPEGFIGYHCESPDWCAFNACQNGGTCVSAHFFSRCVCPPRYSGLHCERHNPCLPNPCENGGECVDLGVLFNASCQCPHGYTGSRCEVEDPCNTDPCQNGGTCWTSINGRAQCTCPTGFTGSRCEVEDPCNNDPCQNGGTCWTSIDGLAQCTCPMGYTGNFCEIEDVCSNNLCPPPLVCYYDNGRHWCSDNGDSEEDHLNQAQPTDIPQWIWSVSIVGIFLIGLIITGTYLYRKRRNETSKTQQVDNLENCISHKVPNVYDELPKCVKAGSAQVGCQKPEKEFGEKPKPISDPEDVYAVINIGYKDEEI